ncbi:MAG: DUF4350 domain-containing protein [Sphingobacteriales bacterium]|nr:MAG: DUF4350 domain-containing protein [Sphingobacteriales bacterium]
MTLRLAYIILLLLPTLTGCERLLKKKTNWNVTLKREDKIPYGTYLAYRSLALYFPQTSVKQLSQWYRYGSLADSMRLYNGEKSLLVLVGLDFRVSSLEWQRLQDFAEAGNEIVLFCSRLDSKIETKLRCRKHGYGIEEQRLNSFNTGKENMYALSLVYNPVHYGYEGRSLQGYFTTGSKPSKEELISLAQSGNPKPDTLGYVNQQPDFIRYAIGDGHISLHGAPLALSNYFLLQPGNRKYLDGIWQTLPTGIKHIYWNDYYKRENKNSDFDMLWQYPATRWALIIALLTLGLYVFFESKRKQRIIPIVDRPENASVSFVETVGRLYYNKGNHANLADKMIQHFLEWVRMNYYLNTNELNDTFIQQLKSKSGQPEAAVTRLIQMIHEVRLQSATVSEPYLYELYNTIQLFYNNKAK